MAGQRDQLVGTWLAAAGLDGGQDGQERAGEQAGMVQRCQERRGPDVQDRGRYRAWSVNAHPAAAA